MAARYQQRVTSKAKGKSKEAKGKKVAATTVPRFFLRRSSIG